MKHYGNIVKDLYRTNTGYEIIKTINKATEDNPEPAYFNLLVDVFTALDNELINLELVQVWFAAQLLRLAGHTPNLHTDESGAKLEAGQQYIFDFDSMNFHKNGSEPGSFPADNIKLLRLIFSDSNSLKTLQKVQGVAELAAACRPLVQSMLVNHIRV